MTRLSPEMRKHLTEAIYIPLYEIADAIATGTADDDVIAAQLVMWAAKSMDQFLYIGNEENWPLFAAMAELLVGAMIAQHYATNTFSFSYTIGNHLKGLPSCW